VTETEGAAGIRRLLAHSGSSRRCAHCPVGEVERTLTGGGERDANDPKRSSRSLLVAHNLSGFPVTPNGVCTDPLRGQELVCFVGHAWFQVDL
jgi:hypothetical protein